MVFVVVDGVPSVGVQVMIGSGKIDKQPVADVADLPSSVIAETRSSDGSDGSSGSGGHSNNAAPATVASSLFYAVLPALSLLFALL